MVGMKTHHHSDSRRVGSELDVDVKLDQEKMSAVYNKIPGYDSSVDKLVQTTWTKRIQTIRTKRALLAKFTKICTC